jgi:hypothetical protein
VRVVATQAGAPRAFTADLVVCAIPFTLLRRVEVAAPFAPDKRSAIQHLQYTSVTRVFVQTRTRFWTAEGLSANASTDLPVMGVYERAINQPGTRGILESCMAGANARRAMLSQRARAPNGCARRDGDGLPEHWRAIRGRRIEVLGRGRMGARRLRVVRARTDDDPHATHRVPKGECISPGTTRPHRRDG